MARQSNSTKAWKKKRANKLGNKYSDPMYQDEEASGPQYAGLDRAICAKGKREGHGLHPDIPLSKHDVAMLQHRLWDSTIRGDKIKTCRMLRDLGKDIERAQAEHGRDGRYMFMFNPDRTEYAPCKPTDHPLYVPAIVLHHEKLLDQLADEWDEIEREDTERAEHQARVDDFLTGGDDYEWTDEDIHAEIAELEAELPFIECPYQQQLTADRMAELCAQMEV